MARCGLNRRHAAGADCVTDSHLVRGDDNDSVVVKHTIVQDHDALLDQKIAKKNLGI
jgi:hypothetical protein